ENGTEIYSRYKPEKVPIHYTAADLIHYHKFTGALADSTIFVGALERENHDLSYIMGFPGDVIGKYSVYYRPETLLRDMFSIIASVVIVITFIALLFGYFFSKKLAKPIVQIISGIQNLSKGKFQNRYKPKGIYKNVFQNLDELASTLESNERERNKLEKMREEWVTNITHDIKTPLASIRGYSEVIQEYELDDAEKARYMEIILNKADYIESLIDDLNLTYKLKSSSLPVKKIDEDVIEIVRDAVIQILNHPLYEDRTINFTTELDQFSFKCDKILIQRALMNLIYNAIVHNPPDTILNVSISGDTGEIQIIIEDDGKGIDQQELEALFNHY